jgi:serine protease Do
MNTGDPRPRRRTLPLALAIAASFACGVFFVATAGPGLGLGSLAGRPAAADPPASARDLESAFMDIAERVNPAVVQIRATRLLSEDSPGRERQNPFQGTPFEEFFRNPGGPGGPGMPGMPFEMPGLGSGAFIRSDGYIVTNNHVVAGPTS